MPVRAARLAAIMDFLHHAPPGSVPALTPLLLPAANGGYVRWYPAAAELAALQPAEETDGNTEPAADSAEEPQSEPDSANGENAG